MRAETKLELKLKLGVSPQMLLEAEILQLPILELSYRIQKELEENPCLEELPQKEEEVEEKKEKDELKGLEDLAGDSPHPLVVKRDEEEERESEIEAPVIGFWDRIEAQLEVEYRGREKELKIARAIIDNLDGEGFLATPVSEIARILGVKEEEVERIRLEISRNFDPVGIASRDRQELYLRQLESMNMENSPLYKLIKEHWYDLQIVGIEEVMKTINMDDKEREAVKRAFQNLYRTPAEKYSEERIEYVYPEVIIKQVGGKLVAELVEWGLPKITLSQYYVNLLKSDEIPEETRKFIKEKVKKAIDFMRAIENRRENILKVTEFIIQYQEDFLLGKTKYLNPITQTEAASILDIPISTFNRVVKGRYADTPVGVFELKFFFAKGVNMGGVQVSQEVLREKIRELIANESKENPLSDKEIAELLRKEGFTIARRTVAEYRKEMGIPNSKKRRKK